MSKQNLYDYGPELVPESNLEAVPAPRTPGLQKENEPYDAERIEQRTRLFGLKVRTFWALVIGLVVLLAAGIGAGLGVGLSQRKNTATTSTTAPASASSSPSSAPSSKSAYQCPSSNGTVYAPISPTTRQNYKFNGTTLQYRVYCTTNFAGGAMYGNPNITDLQMIPDTSSLQECMDSCAVYTSRVPAFTNARGTVCSGIEYRIASGGSSVGEKDCWLKSGVTESSNNATTEGSFHAAVLVQSGPS